MLYNLYATHREPPPLSFAHALLARSDRTDPELSAHLRGFAGFVMDRGRRPMTAMRYGVIQHLNRVRHHLSVEVDDAHATALTAWAREANAIVFTRDGAVRGPDGVLLVDPATGDPAPGAQLPYLADALHRKAATERMLAGRGVRVLSSLPPIVSGLEVELRAPSAVADRCLALFASAVRAETFATSPPPMHADEIRERLPRAEAAMSPRELAFLRSDQPEEQDVIDHVWRYEALAVLAWSLSLIPEPGFPSGLCDVPQLAKAMMEHDGETLVREARLRPTATILDALDQCFRIHWAVTDARVNGQPPVHDVDPGVVFERHRALNWLTCFQDADWDDVDTPT